MPYGGRQLLRQPEVQQHQLHASLGRGPAAAAASITIASITTPAASRAGAAAWLAARTVAHFRACIRVWALWWRRQRRAFPRQTHGSALLVHQPHHDVA